MTGLPTIHTQGRMEWFARAGFRGGEESLSTPERYAQRLVRYIGSDSTIRARLGDRFGRKGLLPIERIAQIRRCTMEFRAASDRRYAVDDPLTCDGHHFTVQAPRHRPSDHTPGGERGAAMPPIVLPAADAHHRPGDPLPVIIAAARVCGIAPALIRSRSRKRPVVRARAFVCAVLRARGNSWSWVGRTLGISDHGSAMYLAMMFFRREIADPAMAQAWQRLAPCIIAAARTWPEFQTMTASGRKVGQ